MDAQRLRGKVPCGVGKHAQRAGKPCLAICGALGADAETLESAGITGFYATSDGYRKMEELQKTCRDDLYRVTVRTMRKLEKKYKDKRRSA